MIPVQLKWANSRAKHRETVLVHCCLVETLVWPRDCTHWYVSCLCGLLVLCSKCTIPLRISQSFRGQTPLENPLRSRSWLSRFPLQGPCNGSYGESSQLTRGCSTSSARPQPLGGTSFGSRNGKIVIFINIKSKFNMSIPYQWKPKRMWGIMLYLQYWWL